MHLILTDGTQLNHIGATGTTKYLQGANRDTITFIFPETYGMDELDAMFTEENCEIINIVTEDAVELEDGTTAIAYTDNLHAGYVIKAGISKEIRTITPATGTTPEVTETQILVTMAQRTYAETKLKENTDILAALLSE